jgi:hypothetical protein
MTVLDQGGASRRKNPVGAVPLFAEVQLWFDERLSDSLL